MKPSRLVAILTAISILGCGQTTNTRLNGRQNEERLNLSAPSVSLIINGNQANDPHRQYYGRLEIDDYDGNLVGYHLYLNGKLIRDFDRHGMVDTNSIVPNLVGLIQSDVSKIEFIFSDSLIGNIYGIGKTITSSSKIFREGYNIFGDLPSGTHTIRVVAYDQSGNQSETETQYNRK